MGLGLGQGLASGFEAGGAAHLVLVLVLLGHRVQARELVQLQRGHEVGHLLRVGVRVRVRGSGRGRVGIGVWARVWVGFGIGVGVRAVLTGSS